MLDDKKYLNTIGNYGNKYSENKSDLRLKKSEDLVRNYYNKDKYVNKIHKLLDSKQLDKWNEIPEFFADQCAQTSMFFDVMGWNPENKNGLDGNLDEHWVPKGFPTDMGPIMKRFSDHKIKKPVLVPIEGLDSLRSLHIKNLYGYKICHFVQTVTPRLTFRNKLLNSQHHEINYSKMYGSLNTSYRNEITDWYGYRVLFIDIDNTSQEYNNTNNILTQLRELGLLKFVRTIIETSPLKYHVYFNWNTKSKKELKPKFYKKDRKTGSTVKIGKNRAIRQAECEARTGLMYPGKEIAINQAAAIQGEYKEDVVLEKQEENGDSIAIRLRTRYAKQQRKNKEIWKAEYRQAFDYLNRLLKGDKSVVDSMRVAQTPGFINYNMFGDFLSNIVYSNKYSETLTLSKLNKILERSPKEIKFKAGYCKSKKLLLDQKGNKKDGIDRIEKKEIGDFFKIDSYSEYINKFCPEVPINIYDISGRRNDILLKLVGEFYKIGDYSNKLQTEWLWHHIIKKYFETKTSKDLAEGLESTETEFWCLIEKNIRNQILYFKSKTHNSLIVNSCNDIQITSLAEFLHELIDYNLSQITKKMYPECFSGQESKILELSAIILANCRSALKGNTSEQLLDIFNRVKLESKVYQILPSTNLKKMLGNNYVTFLSDLEHAGFLVRHHEYSVKEKRAKIVELCIGRIQDLPSRLLKRLNEVIANLEKISEQNRVLAEISTEIAMNQKVQDLSVESQITSLSSNLILDRVDYSDLDFDDWRAKPNPKYKPAKLEHFPNYDTEIKPFYSLYIQRLAELLSDYQAGRNNIRSFYFRPNHPESFLDTLETLLEDAINTGKSEQVNRLVNLKKWYYDRAIEEIRRNYYKVWISEEQKEVPVVYEIPQIYYYEFFDYKNNNQTLDRYYSRKFKLHNNLIDQECLESQIPKPPTLIKSDSIRKEKTELELSEIGACSKDSFYNYSLLGGLTSPDVTNNISKEIFSTCRMTSSSTSPLRGEYSPEITNFLNAIHSKQYINEIYRSSTKHLNIINEKLSYIYKLPNPYPIPRVYINFCFSFPISFNNNYYPLFSDQLLTRTKAILKHLSQIIKRFTKKQSILEYYPNTIWMCTGPPIGPPNITSAMHITS